ncbi:hypothetical protein ACI797_13345 [Geodermatophilus sp. SYSU D00691]
MPEPDYSEFPTTPTAWQERAWQEVMPLALEDPAPPPPPQRRRVDLVALVPGVLFTVLALVTLVGVTFPLSVFEDGGLLWIVLIGAGVLLLARELRRSREKR